MVVLCAVSMLLTFLCIGCHADDSTASPLPSESRQVHKYALPAFSMVLRVSVEQDLPEGDDDGLYLDLEIFQETLEHETQFHLTDIFQQHHDQYADFENEQFIRIQLSTKVRQEINPDQYDPASAPPASSREHVPLHAGFSGVVSFSFPSDAVPPIDRVESAIATVLEDALVAENYLLLFRRYLSSGVLADIEDVYEIRIGAEQLTVLETATKPLSDSEINTNDSSSSQQSGKPSNNANQDQINVVTIVAIVIFLTLSCLLMLFGATVVLVMKDRAKQEQSLQGQTMDSIGMGTKNSARTRNGEAAIDEDAKDGEEEDDSSTTTPAWKRAVLPILRKAVTVRRYWKKQMRKNRKSRRKTKAKGEPHGGTTSDESSDAADDKEEIEEDDGLNDEDVYYDESLSDDEAANQWLDAWQASITSIPVRSVKGNSASSKNPHSSPSKKHMKKKKTSKMPLAPRPAKRQSKKAFLCCIAEEDSVVDGASVIDDLELGDQSLRSAKSPRELDRIEELTSVVLEEDYPTTTSAYGASARKKKQQLEEDFTDDPFDGLSPTSSSSTSASSDEVRSPIQDVDLS